MVTALQFPVKAKEVIARTLPDQLIKQREGGGKKILSYVSGSTVIDLLNEAFGYLWSWDVVEQFVQESQPKFNPRYDKEPQPQGPDRGHAGLRRPAPGDLQPRAPPLR